MNRRKILFLFSLVAVFILLLIEIAFILIGVFGIGSASFDILSFILILVFFVYADLELISFLMRKKRGSDGRTGRRTSVLVYLIVLLFFMVAGLFYFQPEEESHPSPVVTIEESVVNMEGEKEDIMPPVEQENVSPENTEEVIVTEDEISGEEIPLIPSSPQILYSIPRMSPLRIPAAPELGVTSSLCPGYPSSPVFSDVSTSLSIPSKPLRIPAAPELGVTSSLHPSYPSSPVFSDVSTSLSAPSRPDLAVYSILEDDVAPSAPEFLNVESGQESVSLPSLPQFLYSIPWLNKVFPSEPSIINVERSLDK